MTVASNMLAAIATTECAGHNPAEVVQWLAERGLFDHDRLANWLADREPTDDEDW